MTQLFEVNECGIAIHQLRSAHRLAQGVRILCQTEQTVELGEDPNSAKPDAAIGVEFCEETVLELFDRRVPVLPRFFQTADRASESRNDPTRSSL